MQKGKCCPLGVPPPWPQLLMGGTSFSHRSRRAGELCYVMWGLWEVHVGFSVPYPPTCVGLPSRKILWCDKLCEFSDRGRWKWFVEKTYQCLRNKKDVKVRFVWQGSLETEKGRVTMTYRQLSKNKCKTHVGALFDLCWNNWNDRSFGFQMVPQETFLLCSLLLIVLFMYAYPYFSWVSVLQNSKEEALNTALGGDQLHLQDSGLQELARAIIAELRHMPGNEACADCGAPGQPDIVVDDHCRI